MKEWADDSHRTDTRLMVEAAVKEGAVPSEDAAQWHISSAKLLASGDVPGGMSSAIEHLREAPKTPETDLLLRCATLRTQMDSLRNEAASLDVQGVDAFFTMPAQPRADGWRPPAGWRPLERFDDTLDGALVSHSRPRRVPAALRTTGAGRRRGRRVVRRHGGHVRAPLRHRGGLLQFLWV